MINTFNTTALAGHRVLVDDGIEGGNSQVLDSTQWDHFKMHEAEDAVEADFAKAVAEFYAPITEAAEAAEAALNAPVIDTAFYVVESEAVEGVEAQSESLIELSYDSAILRMIESGDTSRLIWVNGSVEILAAK